MSGNVKINSVEYFEVQEAVVSDFTEAPETHKAEEGEYAVNGKEYGPAYYYRVRGCVDYNDDGSSEDSECSAWSDVEEFEQHKAVCEPGCRKRRF